MLFALGWLTFLWTWFYRATFFPVRLYLLNVFLLFWFWCFWFGFWTFLLLMFGRWRFLFAFLPSLGKFRGQIILKLVFQLFQRLLLASTIFWFAKQLWISKKIIEGFNRAFLFWTIGLVVSILLLFYFFSEREL